MALINPDSIIIDSAEIDGLTTDELLSQNWQTTAAVGLGVASGGVAGAIMLAAFPAQTLAVGSGIGVLAYAGKNRADGKSAFPFLDSKEDKSSESPASTATA